MKPVFSSILGNKALQTLIKECNLVCKKVPAHNSVEPQLEYNQDQIPLTNQGSLWPFEPSWELLCNKNMQFQISYTRENR